MVDLSFPEIPKHSSEYLAQTHHDGGLYKHAFESTRGVLTAVIKTVSIIDTSEESEKKRTDPQFPVLVGHIAKCCRLSSSLLELATKSSHGEGSDYLAVQIIRTAIQGVYIGSDKSRFQEYRRNGLAYQKEIAEKIKLSPGDNKRVLDDIGTIFESLGYSLEEFDSVEQRLPSTWEMAGETEADGRLLHLLEMHIQSLKSSVGDLFGRYLDNANGHWTVSEGSRTKPRFLLGASLALIPLAKIYAELFLTNEVLREGILEYLSGFENALCDIFDFQMRSYIEEVPPPPEEVPRQQSTTLKEHKRNRKKLVPPLATMEIQHDSWIDSRLPEMIWAVLIHEHLGRKDAPKLFREFIRLHANQKGFSGDVTISAVSALDAESQELFFKVLDRQECRDALAPLALFPTLPERELWVGSMQSEKPEKLWERLARSIVKFMNHQSQESTDCRWLRVACHVAADKLRLLRPEQYKEIRDYPDYGDQRMVRPTIRASEQCLGLAFNSSKNWADEFWKHCLLETPCITPETVIPRHLQVTSQLSKKYLVKLIEALNSGYVELLESSSVLPKHDAIFGMGTYICDLALEGIEKSESSISGLFCLRTIAEVVINLKYLLTEDSADQWQRYRDYGVGQAKLIKLKFEKQDAPDFLPIDRITRIANEDRWQEFSDIEVGDWSGDNLRKRSITGGTKDIYDKYYDWTSGFSHGQWHAIRFAAFETCQNPLHRFHRMPKIWKNFPSVKPDIQSLVEIAVDTIQREYSGLTLPKINDQT